jgi:hypothetical protein
MIAVARVLAVALTLLFGLTGCASLYWAGASEYEVRPIVDGKQVIGCCSLVVHSGKQYASVDARFTKNGDNYDVTLHEEQIQAFKGQAIAADAASNTLAAGVAAIGTAASTAIKLSIGAP